MSYATQIADPEPLARFVVEENKFRTSDNSVKHNAFLPAPDLATSVFRIENLTEDQVSELGCEHVAKPRLKTLYGWGRFLARDVRESELDVVEETEPHPLHANIVGWSEEKSKQKLQAQELAARAVFVPAPDTLR